MKSTQPFIPSLFVKMFIILCFPLNIFGQDLTGMWRGKIFTSDKTLPYEVAISERDGKLVGYSYTTFNVKGEEMVAMKSINVTQQNGKIIIDDSDLVFNSFDLESPKQLKQTNTLDIKADEQSWVLYGTFKTQKTSKFRQMSGGVRLKKDSAIEQPRLMAKLDEMDLSKSLSFLQPETEVAMIDKVVTTAEKPAAAEKEIPTPGVKAPTRANPTIAPVKKSAPVAVNKPSPKPVSVNAPKPVRPAVVPIPTPPAAVAIAKPTAPVVATVPKPAAPKATPVFTSTFGNRTIETIQTVVFKTDSLQLTLYDNGEVDGDTVSILLNGKTILSKQGLSTAPIVKMIQVTPDMGDSLQLIMYAENLGTLPPNTGLLIIKDGRDRYEIRFAGDLKKNAAVILRRKTGG